MTRTMYLFRLRELLAPMPASDREEVLADINEHFDSALHQGETEQEVIARLGTPESIAVQYGYTDAVHPPAETSVPPVKKQGVGIDRIFSCIGFGFFNLCLGYPLVITFIAVVFSVVASACAVGLSGVLYTLMTMFGPLVPWLQDSLAGFPFVANLFMGIGTTAIGVLASIWTIKLFGLCIRVSVKYLVWSFRWTFCMKNKQIEE